MSKPERVDLVVIGAGAGGLSVAAGAAQLGLKVVLYEAGRMGGDCLNVGCVPSKALLAAAARAHALRTARRFGVRAEGVRIEWEEVRAHLRQVIEAIAPIDSQERFEGLGVRVVRERARFTGPDAIASPSTAFTARRFVIATGARAAVPPLPGLAETPFLTNETVFDLESLPRRLVVLGAGPVGIELGQAFSRLGAEVVLIEAGRALAGMDEEAGELAVAGLRGEGVRIREGAGAVATERAPDGGVRVRLADGTVEAGSHLLLALGRTPELADLGLEAAGVAYDGRGVRTTESLRSSNPRIWAVGDAAGRGQLTHAASMHAALFVRTALFRAPGRLAAAAVPKVVYCDPEIAQIGLTEAEARARFGARIRIARAEFQDNDRARTERAEAGFAKLVVGPGGRLLGAVIAGHQAGELIQIAGLALAAKTPLSALAQAIAPYPTRGEIVKRAAGAYYAPALFSARARTLVGLLQVFP